MQLGDSDGKESGCNAGDQFMSPWTLVEYTKTLCWSIITQGNKAKLRQSPQRLFLVSNNYMLTNWYFLPKGR